MLDEYHEYPLNYRVKINILSVKLNLFNPNLFDTV